MKNFRESEFTKDHERDDQTVQSDTFGHGYEDHGFTEDASVFADGAECGAGTGGNGDTGADAGKSGYESCGGYTRCACTSNDGDNEHQTKEACNVGCQCLFVAFFCLLS